MNKEMSFTEGKIFLPLLRFSIPILLAELLQAMYGAVDLLVVGQFGDASGVSAVSTGSQIMQTITGIITGLTMGTTVRIGQKIGAKDQEGAARTMGGSIALFGLIAVSLSLVVMVFTKQIVTVMHAPAAAFDKTVEYVLICSGGIVFIVAYNVIGGLFRGIGNSKLPLLLVGIACICNIVGDVTFVGVFHMDAAGAALATALSQAVSVVLSILVIRKTGVGLRFSRKYIRFDRREIKWVLKLGAPIALQDSMTNLSFLIITSIINAIGLIQSAAVGVSEKLVVFIMLIPISFMSSVSAFSAQNFGAGKPERANRAMIDAMVTSLCFGVVMFFVAFFHGSILAGFFSKDAPVIAACADYMKSYAIDCILVCVLFCFMGYFNGRGKTLFVMVQGIAGAFLVRIPFSYFVSRMAGATLFEIGFASPLSTMLSLILCVFYYRYIRRKECM